MDQRDTLIRDLDFKLDEFGGWWWFTAAAEPWRVVRRGDRDGGVSDVGYGVDGVGGEGGVVEVVGDVAEKVASVAGRGGDGSEGGGEMVVCGCGVAAAGNGCGGGGDEGGYGGCCGIAAV
ncbi:hypothetical protein Tco_1111811 [Tanacetum coccineum]|uniref:Uncharacterized protein n=1 Tax=Tanacetum coccineum TaxID=301880 RepID=A0ABQ5IQI3_9ASTR